MGYGMEVNKESQAKYRVLQFFMTFTLAKSLSLSSTLELLATLKES